MKKSRFSMKSKKAVAGLLFVSPFIVGFLLFYVRSIALTVTFAFSKLSILDAGGYHTDFVGLDNFKFALASHGTFKQVLASSVWDMVVDVFLIIFFSLFIAIVLNQKFRGRTLARAIFFLPVILNSEAISSTMETVRSFMAGERGITTNLSDAASSSVNTAYYVGMLGDLGLPSSILTYVVDAVSRISNVISMSGVPIVIFIAALQAIPFTLYEVSKIEGATSYETFWKVTFPMVSPLIVTNIVYTVVDSFQKSEVVQLSYDTIFGAEKNYGLGSVFSLLSTVAVCGLLLIVSLIISKRTFYQN